MNIITKQGGYRVWRVTAAGFPNKRESDAGFG